MEFPDADGSIHYGTKPGHFETSKIHFPTSEAVSERNERASERSGGRERSEQSAASEQVSGEYERANGRASDPVLTSLFLFDPEHSEMGRWTNGDDAHDAHDAHDDAHAREEEFRYVR